MEATRDRIETAADAVEGAAVAAEAAPRWRPARRRRERVNLPRGPKADFERFLNDGEVAALMRVSVATVRRLARKGPIEPGGFDIRLAEPVYVGKMRRWSLPKVYALLGIGGGAAKAAAT